LTLEVELLLVDIFDLYFLRERVFVLRFGGLLFLQEGHVLGGAQGLITGGELAQRLDPELVLDLVLAAEEHL